MSKSLLSPTRTALFATAAAAMMLVGCQRSDDRTVGQKIDSSINKAEQKADETKADVKQAAEEAKADVKQAANDAKASAESAANKIENATAKAGDKVADASITASVNAALARDPALSALRINVDTSNGQVMLRGTAPNADARERATQLAANVKGVTSVDNRLEVRG